MSDLSRNNNNDNNPDEVCFYCSHIYSVHYLYNKQVFVSNEVSDTHAGCSYVNSDGTKCVCPGFRSAKPNYNN
jgi:hypothetical protein